MATRSHLRLVGEPVAANCAHQAPASAHPLPDEAWVQLTQGLTWILTGRARTDEEIQKERAISAKTWWSEAGPGWLKPCLEHIRSARNPLLAIEADRVLPLVPLAADDVLRRVPEAERWLERSGYDLDAAYAQVCTEMERLALLHGARRERLYRILWNACALRRFELQGIPQQANPHRLNIPHDTIPVSYYIRGSLLHTMGSGYHGHGELGPIMTSEEVFLKLFSYGVDPDRRPTYLCVRIKGADVLALKAEFELSERRSSAQSELIASAPSESKKLPPAMSNIFDAIRAVAIAKGGDTKWVDRRPFKTNRDQLIEKQLHASGHHVQHSLDRILRAFFKKHWPLLRPELELTLMKTDIPDKTG